jgi:hypothetical protein
LCFVYSQAFRNIVIQAGHVAPSAPLVLSPKVLFQSRIPSGSSTYGDYAHIRYINQLLQPLQEYSEPNVFCQLLEQLLRDALMKIQYMVYLHVLGFLQKSGPPSCQPSPIHRGFSARTSISLPFFTHRPSSFYRDGVRLKFSSVEQFSRDSNFMISNHARSKLSKTQSEAAIEIWGGLE